MYLIISFAFYILKFIPIMEISTNYNPIRTLSKIINSELID